MTTEELATWAGALEVRPPQEILALAAGRFAPRLGLATGFGPEGCVLIDMAARQALDIDYFTLDTGYLFPETYALWQELESRYRITIRGLRSWSPTLADAPPLAPAPWRVDADACCEARKVRPLRAELGKLDAWVTAIRRDQTADRAGAMPVEWDARFGLVKVNPLAHWSAQEVAAYAKAYHVPLNPLLARGYSSIGCAPCTTPVAPGEDPRAGRWRGSAKTECGIHERCAGSVRPTAPSTEPEGSP
ncbi:MAG: phosphoadenosine phosphosulfate reductase [Anaeromyxobacter sp. RBG_16_69_14]|nr:MAG: phosphoadenosine phosphosulfate reductase [Anaeromyxobacter sp. RBG_16_69_14]